MKAQNCCEYIFSSLITLALFGCGGGSVSDPWPGIGDLNIDNSNTRLSSDSFGLKSDLTFSGITPDVSYSITSKCYRRPRQMEEPVFDQNSYEKTVDYQASEQIDSKAPAINHLNDLVLIYPDFFEKCDFTIRATNSVGSTDSSKLEDIRFEYSEDDHDLVLDESEVEETLRASLFEQRSRLKALYRGDIEHPTVITDPAILARPIPESRVLEPKLMCYTDSLKETPVSLSLDLYNNDIETLSFYNLISLHDVTVNHPLENCIFSAVDTRGKRISSKHFDLIRDYRSYNSTFRYHNLQILPELAERQLTYTSNTRTSVPNTPELLLAIDYTNASNEERIIHLGSISELSTRGVFLFRRARAQNIPGQDEVVIRGGCFGNQDVYKYTYMRLNRRAVSSIFTWRSEHLRRRSNLDLLVVPPNSSGTLRLHLELDRSSLSDLVMSAFDGLVIAPMKENKFTQVSFTSPNEFKLNIIEEKSIDEVFFSGERFSSLPSGLRNQADNTLANESIFNLVMINLHQIQTGVLETRSLTDLLPVHECIENSQPLQPGEDRLIYRER